MTIPATEPALERGATKVGAARPDSDSELLRLFRSLLADAVEEVARRVAEAIAVTPSHEPPRWLDLSAAAIYLGLSKNRLYHLTAAKAIPFRKIGQKLIFDRHELDTWVTSFPRLDRLA